jgi:hypothetical protein
MRKRDRYFREIEEYKQRFRGLSTEKLRHRLLEQGAVLVPEARSAIRQLLRERDQQTDAEM